NPSGRLVDRAGRTADLIGDGGRGQVHQVEVGPGVVGDLVARGRDLADQAGVGVDLQADHRERRGHPVLLQQPKDLRGVLRAGPVVDGQRDVLAPVVDVEHGFAGVAATAPVPWPRCGRARASRARAGAEWGVAAGCAGTGWACEVASGCWAGSFQYPVSSATPPTIRTALRVAFPVPICRPPDVRRRTAR